VTTETSASETPVDGRCGGCFATHGQINDGWHCTVHGHSFARYVDSEDWEERWECPSPGCRQGRWIS
jgi:hypothetical protein